jgi:hypothetical protein
MLSGMTENEVMNLASELAMQRGLTDYNARDEYVFGFLECWRRMKNGNHEFCGWESQFIYD